MTTPCGAGLVENRKFKLAVACQLAWITLFVVDNLSEPGLLSLTNLTIGGYLAANVIQKRVTNGKV
jgi:lipid A disaccharide synthetase